MAIVLPIQTFANGDNDKDGWKVVWPNMQSGDIGGPPSNVIGFRDHSVQVEGVFGPAGICAVLGTIDGMNYRPVRDPFGVILNVATASVNSITEHVFAIIPQITGGDGTTLLTVTAALGKTKP